MLRFGSLVRSSSRISGSLTSSRATAIFATARSSSVLPFQQVPASSSSTTSSLSLSSLHRHIQIKNHWQAVIRRNKIDPKTGQRTFQDWDDVMDQGFHNRPTLATTGQPLLDRYMSVERHIKPKEIRRQLNAAKIYKRSVKRVDDLVSYIQFMRTKDKEDNDL